MTGTEQVAALIAEVNNAATVEKSAEVFINGFQAAVQAAAAAITANGVTAEQLQPLTDLGTALDAESNALAAAIAAATGATPPPARKV